MNIFAKFDENPAVTLQVIKKTKRYGRTDTRTDNVKTVYPTTNKVCWGYNNILSIMNNKGWHSLQILNDGHSALCEEKIQSV